MKGNDDCEKWYREEYLARLPTPARNTRPLPEINTSEYGLVSSGFYEFVHEVEFSVEQFVSYLVTQTNVISAVETGKDNLQSVTNWLLDSARPMFSGKKEKFSFFCQIQFFKRS